MVIKCLIENTTNNETLVAEHGLSLYIEGPEHRLLFDLGMSGGFADNARTMGVDISSVDTVVISHGHYDHGGGLERFLELNKKADIWLSNKAFGHFYSSRADGTMKYIGLDRKLMDNPRIKRVKGREKISKCLTLFDNQCHETPLPIMNRFLYEKIDGKYVPDQFGHELNLKITCGGKKILIAGCAHNGIENIIETYMKEEKVAPNIIVGGFHLSSGSRQETASEDRIRQLGERLKKIDSEIYTCHCTGKVAYELLRLELGEQICYLAGGRSIHI